MCNSSIIIRFRCCEISILVGVGYGFHPLVATESHPICNPRLVGVIGFLLVPVIARIWNEPVFALNLPEVAELLPFLLLHHMYMK